MSASDILTAIEKLPFLGTVIGALIALGGVIISNRHSTKRLLIQLETDNINKRIERENNLKKEIYLESLEAIDLGMTVLSRLTELEVPSRELITQYNENTSALHKIFVVADTQTSKVYMEFLAALNGSYMQLSHDRNVLLELVRKKNFLKQELERINGEGHTFLTRLYEESLKSNPDLKVKQNLLNQIEFLKTQRSEKSVPHDEMANTIYLGQLDLFEAVKREQIALSSLQVSIFSAIRKELDLPFDEIAFKKISDDISRRISEDLKSFRQKGESEFL